MDTAELRKVAVVMLLEVLYQRIRDGFPDSPDRELVLVHLDEARLWAEGM